MDAVGVTDAAINVTLVRAFNLMQVALIAALVTPTALVLVLVRGGGCSCMLLVQPTPTCTNVGLVHLRWWCLILTDKITVHHIGMGLS